MTYPQLSPLSTAQKSTINRSIHVLHKPDNFSRSLHLAIDDPLGRDWHILGLEHMHVTASFLNTAQGATAIFVVQTAAIVVGHVMSIAVAHFIVVHQGLPPRTGLLLEAPLTILMIAYTAFGLWTLAAPAIA